MTMEIKTANAQYTGGGIYIYYGLLTNGNYFRACDEWECIEIVDADPSVEDADYCDWYDHHRITQLIEDEYKSFWNLMLEWIIQNQPFGNYATNELENRLMKKPQLYYRSVYENCPMEKQDDFILPSDFASGWYRVETSKEDILEQLKGSRKIRCIQFMDANKVEIETMENKNAQPVENEKVAINGIIMQYGDGNDYSIWTDFTLTAEEEEAIWKILMNHDTEGGSVRGKWNEVLEDVMV